MKRETRYEESRQYILSDAACGRNLPLRRLQPVLGAGDICIGRKDMRQQHIRRFPGGVPGVYGGQLRGTSDMRGLPSGGNRGSYGPERTGNTELETTIAEKLDAILDLMEFSSRMKDYYDIYYLANKFDFDGATLTKALKKTFENRGHSFTVEQFEQVMAFAENDAMQKKWKAFTRKIDIKTDDYSTVLKTIKSFLTKPYTATVRDKEFNEKWSAYSGTWM